jgi:hypothetical protein
MKTTSIDSRPRVVAWLGYGGLIPFLVFAVLTCADRERSTLWQASLRGYGAVILSFVGALHWGFAMLLQDLTPSRREAVFIWSVTPALAAFAALVMQSFPGDVLLVALFVAQYWRDRRLAATAALPGWYLPLRLHLTAVAILCIGVGIIAADR